MIKRNRHLARGAMFGRDSLGCVALTVLCSLSTTDSAHAGFSPAAWLPGATTDSWFDAANWDIGMVPCGTSAPHYDVLIESDLLGPYDVRLNLDCTIGRLTLGQSDRLTIENDRELSVVGPNGAGGGGLLQDGMLRLESIGAITRLHLADQTLLTGDAVWSMTPTTNNRITNANFPQDRFIIEQGSSLSFVEGSLDFGEQALRLVNNGLMHSMGESFVQLRLNGSLMSQNAGTIRSSDTGRLEYRSGVLNNTGLLEALGASTLDVSGGRIENAGGVLRASETGIILFSGSPPAEIVDGTIESTGSGCVEIADGGGVALSGNVAVNADILMSANAGSSTLLLEGGLSLNGHPILYATEDTQNLIVASPEPNDPTVIGPSGILTLANGSASYTGELVNQGTVEVAGGATLYVNDSLENAPSGVLRATGGGSVLDFGGGVVHGGVLETENGGLIKIPCNTAGQMSGDVLLDGVLRIDACSGLQAWLEVVGMLRALGDWQIEATPNSNNRIRGSTGPTDILEIAPDASVTITTGRVNIGDSFLTFHNQGLVDSQTDNTSICVTTSGLSENDGVLQASNGGELTIACGLLNNESGIVRASGTDAFVNLNGGTLQGGLMQTENGGRIRVPCNTTGELSGDVELDGVLRMEACSGLQARLEVVGMLQMLGDWQVEATSDTNNRIRGSTGPTDILGIAPDASVTILSGELRLGDNLLTMQNHGVITSLIPELLIQLAPGGANTNSGEIHVTSAGYAGIYSQIDNTGGTYKATNSSVIEFDGAEITGGQIDADPTSEIRLAGAQSTFHSVSNEGVFRIPATRTLGVMTSINNDGVMTVNERGTIIAESGVAFTGTGSMNLDYFDGNQYGTLMISDNGTVTNGIGHTISGAGYVTGGTLINSGVVKPNSTSVPLHVTGIYNQTADGVLHVRLDRTTGTPTTTMLAVNGPASLLGRIDVEITPGPLPLPSDSFTVLTSSGLTANLANENGGVLSTAVGTFDIQFNGGSVILTNYTESALSPADVNCDGMVTIADVQPLVNLLTNRGAGCHATAGDVNGDGNVNGLDIQAFVVELLS